MCDFKLGIVKELSQTLNINKPFVVLIIKKSSPISSEISSVEQTQPNTLSPFFSYFILKSLSTSLAQVFIKMPSLSCLSKRLDTTKVDAEHYLHFNNKCFVAVCDVYVSQHSAGVNQRGDICYLWGPHRL